MLMRGQTVFAAAALLLISTVFARAGEAIKWQTDFEGAKAASKKSHKLILVDFYAEW